MGLINRKERYYISSAVKSVSQFLLKPRQYYRVKPTLIRKYSTSESPNIDVKLNLNNFYESFPSFSEKSKYLYLTKNIQDASQVLKDMYNSLPESNTVKVYLYKNCWHLLSWQEFMKGGNLQKDWDFVNYRVNSDDKQGHPRFYKGKSGCYIFWCINDDSYYIGSAICLYNRYKSHKLNSYRPERGGDNALYSLVHKFDWHHFIWKPLIITTNHINNFIKQNIGIELDLDSLFILRSFTQFEARIYEQALLTHYIPKLNSSYTVVFPFNSWQKGAIFKSDTSKPIVIKGDETSDFIMEFSSKNRAAISLGIPKTTFDRYVNLKNHSVYSPILEMDVFLIDKSKLLSEDSPNYSKNDNLMQLTGVDLYGFEKGKLFALLLDKKSIFGVYNNASQAAKSLDGKSESKYISRYINLERPVLVGPEKEPVYFVMNPDWKTDLKGRVGARPSKRKRSSISRSIVLVDVLNNSSIIFETISDMSRFLGRKSVTDTGFVKKYMNPTKLYKGQFEFYYESDFTGTITGKGSCKK